MSKVLVDRELLERTASHLEWDGSEPMTTIQFAQKCDGLAAAIRDAIAQPAEAEGVEVVGFLYKNNGQALTAAGMDADTFALIARSDFDGEVEKLVRQSDHLAALSAVTAERDRLREQCRIHDMLHGTKGRERFAALLAEIDQLRAEVEASRLLLEQCNEVIAEDGGVCIELRAFLAGTMPASDVIALLRDAAMAAKEA